MTDSKYMIFSYEKRIISYKDSTMMPPKNPSLRVLVYMAIPKYSG